MSLIDYIFTGVVDVRLQLVAIISSVLLLIVIVQLVRQERLKEGYAILWILVSLLLTVFSVWVDLLQSFASWVGVAYPPAALFLIVIGGLVVLSLHFSLLLCRYDRRIRRLAQEHAMLKLELENKLKNLK
jgi:hypothetical protein